MCVCFRRPHVIDKEELRQVNVVRRVSYLGLPRDRHNVHVYIWVIDNTYIHARRVLCLSVNALLYKAD